MKKQIFILSILMLMQLATNAQVIDNEQSSATIEPTEVTLLSKINYQYDANGNRINRTVIVEYIFGMPPIGDTKTNPTDTTNETLCFSAGIIDSIANNKTNINNEVLNGDIKVFPNPVQEKFYVKFTGASNADGCILQIYDGSGKIFYQATATQNQTEINMSQAKAGIYYLVVVTLDGKRLWWKVSKG